MSRLRGLVARPSIAGLVDAAAVLLLTVVALTAFSGTFDGWGYLIAVVVGGLTGVLVAVVTGRLRLPWYAVLPLLVVALLLIGPPITLRESTVAAWPGPGSAVELGRLLVSGWRELLTTLPPLSATGPMTVLPFSLALVGASVGMLIARSSGRAFLPVLGPAFAGVVAVLMGILTPGEVLVRGLLLAAVAVGWGMARRRRRIESSPGGGLRRALTATALVAVAGASAAVASPVLDRSVDQRTVFRPYVRPPIDLTDQPSPLASFRRFRPAAKALADVDLFTVRGLPQGTVVRIATLDTYSGSVWAAGNGGPGSAGTSTSTAGGSRGFLKIGSRIPVTESGRAVSATVRIAPAYAADRDLSVWLPTVGEPTSLTFAGPDAARQQAALRYNPDTRAGLVSSRLRTGDTYSLTAVLPDDAATPVGSPPSVSTPNTLTSVTAKLVTSTPAGSDRLAQVKAIGERLRTIGAYSDGPSADASGAAAGTSSGESTIVPGHSLGRLRSFLSDAEPAGNDEQYAAALALAAEYVGLPARIVLGAVPDASGVVKGADVRTWVEVAVDRGRWVSLAPETFVPPIDKKPKPRSTVEEDRTHAAIVPPPNAQRPPSSLDGFILDDSTSGRQRDGVEQTRWVLPRWVVIALQVTSVPVGAVLGWTLLLVGGKALRRSARRRRGVVDTRIAGAWRDVIDTLRDAGWAVSPTFTRTEVSRVVGTDAVTEAARYADRMTYGPERGTDDDVAQAWALAQRVRTQQAATLSWRERWRAAVSLRSVVPGFGGVAPLTRPSALQQDRVVPELDLGSAATS